MSHGQAGWTVGTVGLRETELAEWPRGEKGAFLPPMCGASGLPLSELSCCCGGLDYRKALIGSGFINEGRRAGGSKHSGGGVCWCSGPKGQWFGGPQSSREMGGLTLPDGRAPSALG